MRQSDYDQDLAVIESYPNYLVTVSGVVISLARGKPKVITGRQTRHGYIYVDLWKEGKVTTKSVHRLVAEAFLPNPDNLPQVNHIDEDKTNNHVSNLEWCTCQHNNAYSKAKWYVFKSPEGELVEVYNLRKFCREQGLSQGSMSNLTGHSHKTCKGWRFIRYGRL